MICGFCDIGAAGNERGGLRMSSRASRAITMGTGSYIRMLKVAGRDQREWWAKSRGTMAETAMVRNGGNEATSEEVDRKVFEGVGLAVGVAVIEPGVGGCSRSER